jgi:hypothetical protein
VSDLVGYDPIWEKVRVRDDLSRVYEDDSVLIATDFEGGNGHEIRKLGENFYAMRPEPDPGEHRFKGVGYYACFGVRSKLDKARAVRVRLQAKVHSHESWLDHRHMIVRRAGRWSQLDPRAIRPVENTTDTLEVDLELPGAGEKESTLFVSNFHWWPNSERVQYMKSLRNVRLREIGRSYENRPIYAVELGREDLEAPCILQSQTMQPSEVMASHAIRGMIDFLLSDDPEARRICETFRLCFIPVTNPDGSARGHCVADAQGRFPTFETNLAAEGDPQATAENLAFWRYVSENRPWLFWEWHSNNWFRRPGHVLIRCRSNLTEDRLLRSMWDEIDERLLTLPDTFHEEFVSHTESPYQPTPEFQVAVHLGSISSVIKQHERFSLETSRDHAVACLKTAAAVYWEKATKGR